MNGRLISDESVINSRQPPDGMDPDEWARLMAQMGGDFSFEKARRELSSRSCRDGAERWKSRSCSHYYSSLQDPERRRILEKLAKRGMSFGGGGSME